MPVHPSRRKLLGALAFALAAGSAGAARADAERPLFLFFHAFDCPHCEKAKPFVAKLEKQHPHLRFESWEVKKDRDGRRRFAKEVKRLSICNPGVPLFVFQDQYVMGWLGAETERSVRRMIARSRKP
jgi:thiol-disulfide isomerase/thioredoxin